MSFIEVNGNKIYYDKYGDGPEVVLLIPGPIGTPVTDFPELLDGEDELDFDQFTAIAVEPAGNGRSRPPQKSYNVKFYENESETLFKFMQNLGHGHYSVIGWSEGAKVALHMAMKYRDTINALVLVSISNFWPNNCLKEVLSKNSVESWNKSRIETYLKCYKSKDEIQKLWNKYIQFVQFYNQYFPTGDVFNEKYYLVKCPVLIVHGDKDPTIDVQQPLKICRRLQSARIHRFPNGDHECHIKYSSVFKKIVEDHIVNRNNYVVKCELSTEERAEQVEATLWKQFA